jgi:hypothetical protein
MTLDDAERRTRGNLCLAWQVECPMQPGQEIGIMEKSAEQRQSERQVLTHIQDLVAEEHQLLAKGPLADPDHERLTHLQVELDQCWDLLRQRRALRATGGDPEHAQIRPPDIVEKYVG